MGWVQREVCCGTQACTAAECEEFPVVWFGYMFRGESLQSSEKAVRIFLPYGPEASSSPKRTKLSV